MGTTTTARSTKAESIRVFPPLQLTRAGYLAVHLSGKYRDRSALPALNARCWSATAC
ncbi:hypothetical protein KIF59_15025 [Enterobacter cloacae subsp. cloacae]|nr:hypothetical protein [Enterobacter cloacae subsp. cloacae]